MRATTFLMFTGDSEAWLNLVTSTVPDSRIVSIQRHGPDGPGTEGSVSMAEAVVGGIPVRCNDSPPVHEFTFTPSMSFFIDLDDEAQQTAVHDALIEGGSTLMPLGDYGFSQRFAWIQDRYGVSWQLNLP
ncbi:MAG: VOC family protein [Actinomycetota bacterium]|nr:VOC family protein [Actinomycetota bacterium]